MKILLNIIFVSIGLLFLEHPLVAQNTFEKIIDVNNDNNRAYDIKVASDSTYILVSDGFYYNQEDSSNFASNTIFKLDKEGNTIWQKSLDVYPNGIQARDLPNSLIISKDGGILFLGITYSEEREEYDSYLCKLSSEGDSLWCKTYGGTKNDYPYTMVETPDGGFAFAGVTYSYGDTIGDAFLMKIDNLGNLLWTQTYGDKGEYDVLGYVYVDNDGGFILSGFERDSVRNRKSYVVKTDEMGNEIWSQTYGTPMEQSYTAHVIPASKGGYWMNDGLDMTYKEDTISGTFYIAQLDQQGNIKWQREFYSNWWKEGRIAELSDGNLMIVGFERLGPSFWGEVNAWATKLTPQAEVIWDRTYVYKTSSLAETDPPLIDRSHFMVGKETLDGGFIMTGGADTDLYTNGKVNQQAWLLKVDSNGCLEPDCGDEIVLSIEEANEQILAPIASLQSSPFTLYPQPSTSNTIYLELLASFQLKPATQARIYDLHGRLILQQAITEHLNSMNVASLPKGLYYCELVGENGEVLGGSKLVR